MASLYGLLLLPPPPNSADPPEIRAAFEPPFEAVLNSITRFTKGHGEGATLEIALPYPVLHSGSGYASREKVFYIVQRLLVSAYSLLGSTLERFSARVDCRIILIDYRRDYEYGRLDRLETNGSFTGALSAVRLPTLASSRRPWTHIFAVEGEQGERLFQNFLTLSYEKPFESTRQKWQTERVRGGLVLQRATNANVKESIDSFIPAERYSQVFTYSAQKLDFHGKIRLSMAAFLAFHSSPWKSKLLIGVDDQRWNGNENLPNSSAPHLPDWKSQQEITQFLRAILCLSPVPSPSSQEKRILSDSNSTIVELPSNYSLEFSSEGCPLGWATFEFDELTAVVVQPDSRNIALGINEERYKRGLPKFAVLEVFEYTVDDLDSNEDVDRARTAGCTMGL